MAKTPSHSDAGDASNSALNPFLRTGPLRDRRRPERAHPLHLRRFTVRRVSGDGCAVRCSCCIHRTMVRPNNLCPPTRIKTSAERCVGLTTNKGGTHETSTCSAYTRLGQVLVSGPPRLQYKQRGLVLFPCSGCSSAGRIVSSASQASYVLACPSTQPPLSSLRRPVTLTHPFSPFNNNPTQH